MNKNISLSEILGYLFIFVCLFTSSHWDTYPELAQGEIIRFDKISLFGQINIYYLFGVIFFLTLMAIKFSPQYDRGVSSKKNFLKTIFWLYFIPVNILQYLTIYMKDIPVNDFGVRPIARFFVFLTATYFIQDIFLKNKNNHQLEKIINILEILILIRCFFSIIKYHLGFGYYISFIGGIRLGQENDLADFFLLLFIISSTRLIFEKNSNKIRKTLHILGITTSSYIAIASLRRYLWAELILGIILISFFYYRNHRKRINILVITICSIIFISSTFTFFLGPRRITQNKYIGRIVTIFSLFDSRYESQYGTLTGHRDEIIEGWQNVKKHWLLGVTIYGGGQVERYRTRVQDIYVHNAFLGIWLIYGLPGLILFIALYIKAMLLSNALYKKLKSNLGLILFIFLICQTIKNLIWQTAITNTNVTIIYILLISLVLRAKEISNRINANAKIEEKQLSHPEEPNTSRIP